MPYVNFTKTAEELKNFKLEEERKTAPVAEEMLANRESKYSLFYAIDKKAGEDKDWLNQFNTAFKKEYKTDIDFLRTLNEEEKEAITKFATTRNTSGDATIGNIIQTNILTAIDDFFAKSTLLSKVQIIKDVESYQLPEFADELTAEQIAENATGTAVDSVPRSGDTLTLGSSANKIKIQYELTELALKSLNPVELGIMQARLLRGLEKKIEQQIISGNNTNQFCGFINSLTGANAFGAIPITFSIVEGERPENHVDALEYMVGELPSDIDDEQVANYVAIVNRKTKTKIIRTMDVNQRYYFDKSGGVVRSLQSNIMLHTSSNIADDVVLLVDLSKYLVLLKSSPEIKIKEAPDNEIFYISAVAYADGGMRMGYKFKADGTTPNLDKNAFRVATLKADYTL